MAFVKLFKTIFDFRLKLAAAVSILLTAVTSFSAPLCSQVLNNSKHDRSLEDYIHQRYMTNNEIRSSTTLPNGESGQLIIQQFQKNGGAAKNALETYKIIKGSQLSADPSRYKLFERVSELFIDFVIKSFTERRNWSEDLRAQVTKQAAKYAPRSMFILYREWKEIKGTLKIVEASEQNKEELPVDENLGVSLPFNGGLKYEVGNFALNKSINKEGFVDCFMQLMLHAGKSMNRPNHIPNQPMYFAYTEANSIKMYTGLGFHLIPGFEGNINKYGTDWKILGISAEDLIKLPERLKSARSAWGDDFLEEFAQYFKKYKVFADQQLDVIGWSSNENLVYITRPYSRLEGNQYSITISQKNPRRNFSVYLPDGAFPFKEGQQFTTADGQFNIQYSRGLLHIYDNTSLEHHYIIEVDAHFKQVKSLNLPILKNRMNR